MKKIIAISVILILMVFYFGTVWAAQSVTVSNTTANPVPVTGTITNTTANPVPVTGTVTNTIFNPVPAIVTNTIDHSVPVTVTNLTAAPVPVAGTITNTTLNPVPVTGTVNVQGSSTTRVGVMQIVVTNGQPTQIYLVPAGKTLVIEHLSVGGGLVPANTTISCNIQTLLFGTPGYILTEIPIFPAAPLSISGAAGMSLTAKLYADGNSTVFGECVLNGLSDQIGLNFSFFGHLE